LNIRVKTIVILALICAGVVGTLYTTSQIILLNSFARIEEQNTQGNAQRVVNAFSDKVSDLDVLNANGWASWNATYNFIVNNNTAYIASNLVDENFQQAGINCMLFINSSGQLVYGKAFDLQNGTQIPLAPDLLELVASHPLLWSFNSTSSYTGGVILLSEGPMLVSSEPILTSEGLGPIRGALVMGEYLTQEKLSEISSEVQLPLTLETFNNPELPPDFQLARSSLSSQAPIFVKPLNGSLIAGYALLSDVFHNPILIIRADMPRTIYAQGQTTINYFMISSLLLLVVLGSVTMLLLEKTVISRLTGLSRKVSSIGKTEQISARVPTQGNDEITRVAESINNMLTEIENKTNKLKSTERFAAIGELSAMIGHDLRNPLTGIAGASYYLKTKHGPNMDKKGIEMLRIIDADIEYSNKIISDLLEYSREIKLELTVTTPNRLLKEALSLIEVPKNTQIIDQTRDEPEIRVDTQKLTGAFLNIIKNAFDAMPNGGKLTIKSDKLNDEVRISFTDTGVGMTEETLSKLWSPLFTTKAKGMGFGLSICKRIVEAHDGKISVASEVGKGSAFVVSLPIKSEIKENGEIFVNLPESFLSSKIDSKARAEK
jgi:sensor domain CHASE-containing protein/nitrogen-specific signal transduction histidine kinase